MIIEIRGIQFLNKGSELMLHAILKALRKKLKGIEFAVVPNLVDCPYQKIAALGIYQKIWLQRFSIQWGIFGHLIPKNIRIKYGLVSDSEIDIVLDASGFAYGDQWGADAAIVLSKYIKRAKRDAKKIILLPQAFGPFKGKRIKRALIEVVNNADLIYAREEESYKYIIELTGKRNNVRMAPDFTSLVSGILPSYFDKKRHQLCIIPNKRMIDKLSKNDSIRYMELINECMEKAFNKSIYPFILIHGGDEDRELAKKITTRSNKNIEIICEDDPLIIKGIIGASYGLIGSRYHGLVSALSQGIPALGIGWSHKYRMLFKDYNYEEGFLQIDISNNELEKKLHTILSEKEKNDIKSKINIAAEKQKLLTSQMWDDVIGVINK